MPKIKIPTRKQQKLDNLLIQNPGKGLNNFVSDSLIDDHEASDLLNIQFTESGCPSKSYGFTQLGDDLTNNPKGLGVLYTSSVRRIVTIDGTSAKYLNSGVWTALSGATFTNGAEVNFVQARDALYIWNGVDAGAKYDGTTLTRPTTTVSASFGIFYAGRQIVSGVSSQPYRIYISNATAADDFTVTTGGTAPQPDNSTDAPGATSFTGTPGLTEANIIDVGKGDGDKITGFSKFQEQLIIFKERSIYKMSFDSSGTPVIDQITSSMGCVSHKSIETVDNDVFFLSRTGYFVLGNEPNFNAAIRTNELSSRIKPTIDTINSTNLTRVASLYSDYKFYSSISSGGSSTNNRTLVYDKRYLAWSILDYMKANAFVEYIDTDNSKHIYFASDDTNKIYEIGTGYSADGTAIAAQWTSKAFDVGSFDTKKGWQYIDLLFRQVLGTITITIYSDNNQIVKQTSISSATSATGSLGTQMLGEQILGGTGDTPSGTSTNNIPYRIRVRSKSRTLKIKISNSNDNESFTLLEANLFYFPYNPYVFDSAYKIY